VLRSEYLRANVTKNQAKFEFGDPWVDMKRDVDFWSSRRFGFEKIEENDFRLDGRRNGRWRRLKIGNL